jgi:hypothetical protein
MTDKQPRVFHQADPEPDRSVLRVQSTNSQVFSRWLCPYVGAPDLWQAGPRGTYKTWEDLTALLGNYTLTDVTDRPAPEILKGCTEVEDATGVRCERTGAHDQHYGRYQGGAPGLPDTFEIHWPLIDLQFDKRQQRQPR